MIEAPSFDAARSELFTILEPYSFARVIRKATIPDNAKEIDISGKEVITYYHSIAITSEKNSRVWFKKPVDDVSIQIGPVTIKSAPAEYIPKVGDIIMGKAVKERKKRDRDRDEDSFRYIDWFPNAKCFQLLFELIKNGTSVPELQLANALRTVEGRDDIFALARLILFGNVKSFADQHLGTATCREMKLSVPPLEFVYHCSRRFEDDSIWNEFLKLVPDAKIPVIAAEEASPTEPVIVVKPFVRKVKPVLDLHKSIYGTTASAYNPDFPSYDYSGGASTAAAAYTGSSYAYNPDSPPYNPCSPPASPLYSPVTPPKRTTAAPEPNRHYNHMQMLSNARSDGFGNAGFSPPKKRKQHIDFSTATGSTEIPAADGFSPRKKSMYSNYDQEDE